MNRASLAVRIIAIAVIALSPWLRPRARANTTRSVVYVVDRSTSVGESGIARANEFLRESWNERRGAELGAVAVDTDAEVITPLGTPLAPEVAPGTRPYASDLAAGIRLAAGVLPRAGHRSIVLLTDARSTRGDAESEVRAAAAQGIRVDVVPIAAEESEPGGITSVRPRALHVAEGQPVNLDVELDLDREGGRAWIEWSRDGRRMPPRSVPRAEGDGPTKIELHDSDAPPGLHVYEVRAVTFSSKRHRAVYGDDDPAAPPPVLAAVSVEGKAHAVVFSGGGDVPPVLAAALKESGLGVRGLPVDRVSDVSAFSGADMVILSDVRVSEAAWDEGALTRSNQSALVDYVQQGGGLLVTGGVFGLAPEYGGTPLARVLPVEIQDKGHVEDPPVALAIMLDRSGSMSAQVGSHTKIEMAIEASLSAADTLRPAIDQVAIASVDERTNWDVPLGPAERLAGLRSRVRKVTADGGGIFVYTALRDAYAALASARAPVRHVILFSDTSDSEEQYDGCAFLPCSGSLKSAESLAREARARGITTTVVGIGDANASDTAFLKRVAASSGGRFYLTEQGTDLRRIFLSETRVLSQSNLREKKTNVAGADAHPLLAGVDVGKLPPLSSYVESGRRAGADTPLVLADSGRPLLATWRYGLGKAAAVTTDLYEGWGGEGGWGASADAAQLLRQTLRFLLRQQSAHRADANVRVRDRVAELDIELPPDAPDSAAPKTIEVFAVDKRGSSRPLTATLEPRGPGRWVARARTGGESIVIARARDGRGALMAEALGREDTAVERAGAGVDERAAAELARIGDGRVGPTASETMRATSRPGVALEPTWPWALLLAGALVVIDLFLRRMGNGKRAAESSAALAGLVIARRS